MGCVARAEISRAARGFAKKRFEHLLGVSMSPPSYDMALQSTVARFESYELMP